MQTFRKYEFTPSQWATAKKKIELTGTYRDGETYTYWNPEQVAAVIELGKMCIEWFQTEEGRICAKESPKVSVDILWAGEPMTTGFSTYVVWPEPCGVHAFGGWEAQYAIDYCAANPTAAYCQAPAPLSHE